MSTSRMYNVKRIKDETYEPGKRHDVRAHEPEVVSDWLNPLSLGTICQPPLTLRI